MVDKTIKIGANVFIIRNGKLLLGKRRGHGWDGQWSLPGGHVKYGETLKDAAKRELKEETGIVATKFQFLYLADDPRDDAHYIHVGFLAKDAKGEPELREPDIFYKWEWFSIDSIPQKIFIENKKLIEAFLNNQTFIC